MPNRMWTEIFAVVEWNGDTCDDDDVGVGDGDGVGSKHPSREKMKRFWSGRGRPFYLEIDHSQEDNCWSISPTRSQCNKQILSFSHFVMQK